MPGETPLVADALCELFVMVFQQRRERDLSLTALATLGRLSRSGACRVTDLAASEGVTQPSMTVAIGQLQRLGLVEKQTDAGDGRVVRVAITRAGRNRIRATRRQTAQSLATLIDELPAAQQKSLTAALPALRTLATRDLNGSRTPQGTRATRRIP